MPIRNEAYRITKYPRERRHKVETRVNFHGFNYGYAGDPLLLKESERILLIQKLPSTDWSGMGMTSYYGPELVVALRVPGTVRESRSSYGREDEIVVVVWERDYDRQTRTATYREAEEVMARHEKMPKKQLRKVIIAASTHHAGLLAEMDEVKKRLGHEAGA